MASGLLLGAQGGQSMSCLAALDVRLASLLCTGLSLVA